MDIHKTRYFIYEFIISTFVSQNYHSNFLTNYLIYGHQKQYKG